MRAYGLATHIWSNNWKSAILLAGFPVLLILLTYGLFLLYAGLSGDTYQGSQEIIGPFLWAADALAHAWPYALVAAGLWFACAYVFYQGIIDAATGAYKLERKANPRIYNLLENLCISRGIPMPELRMIDTDALNAFATGLHEKQYSITVTRGLADTLNDAELEAVLAHELTHIRNRDVRLLIIAVIFVGIFSFVGEILFRWMRITMWTGGGRSRSSSSERRSSGGAAAIAIIAGLALIAIAYALAIVIRFALSRRREYLADAGSVELTKNPDAMISALSKIEGHSKIEAPSEVREMFIENPHAEFAGLFATHPPIEKRIAALVDYAGGREAEPAAATMGAGFGRRRKRGPWG